MSNSKLNMSLDDLIKKNRENHKKVEVVKKNNQYKYKSNDHNSGSVKFSRHPQWKKKFFRNQIGNKNNNTRRSFKKNENQVCI